MHVYIVVLISLLHTLVMRLQQVHLVI